MADARVMVMLRPATESDSRPVWEWRNDPATRTVSADTAEVPWSRHETWFRDVLADPARHVLIAEVAGRSVGMVRFDAEGAGVGGRWTVSINLAPEARGRGLGAPTLVAGWNWLTTVARVAEVVARIRPTNTASIRVFEAAGYAAAGSDDGWLAYARRAHGTPAT